MSAAWESYRRSAEPRPREVDAWTLHGAGLEHLRMAREPLPQPGPDELLVRVDAVGLCSSDAKMIRMGRGYPLFYGRDLAAQPVRLGHEVSLTVVDAGADMAGQCAVGQRLGLQPDVFVRGVRTCFGVLLPGGLTQYLTLGDDVLRGDGGNYTFPVDPALSYADVALSEPWACVDVAYTPKRRLSPKRGGTLWIIGRPGDAREYTMNREIESVRVVLTCAPRALAGDLRARANDVQINDDLDALLDDASFSADDIVLLEPRRAALVTRAARRLAYAGTLTVVGEAPLDAPAALDVGRLHYEPLGLMGCRGPDIAAAFGPARNRSELKSGGVMLILGAGGAMGRMHIQRALQMTAGPRAIIAANRGAERIADLADEFAALARETGRALHVVSTSAEPGRLEAEVAALTRGRGCDDVVVVAPTADAIRQAVPHMAIDGQLMLFAGVPPGTEIPLPVDHVYLHNAQITGTSGSLLEDQVRVLAKASAGELSPAQSVVAVAGMRAAGDALRAVLEHRYPGKIVVFPSLPGLPLTSLRELAQHSPGVSAALGPGLRWTAAAEQALFEHYLPNR